MQAYLISNGGAFAGTFSNRNANSINYDSPNFSGFSVSAQTASTKAASTVTTAGLKGRANSISLNYAAGPMTLAGAYSVHDDNRSATALNGGEDKAIVLAGTYTIGAARIGLIYVDAQAQGAALTGEIERKSWNLAGTFGLGGPHSLVGGYTHAGDAKATGTSVGAAATGANTGAKQYTIGYRNALSKRTMAGLYYLRAKNDSMATGYSVGSNHATSLVAGSSSSVVVMQLAHTF